MELEWDEEKRRLTQELRGLDFADILHFDFDSAVTWEDERKSYGERRFNTTGFLDGVLCTFCWTPRGAKLRIISMRKINARERAAYFALKDGSSDP